MSQHSLKNLGPTFFLQNFVQVPEVKDLPDQLIRVMIRVQFVGEYPIGDVIENYQRFGSKVDKPQDAINALNIILGPYNFS